MTNPPTGRLVPTAGGHELIVSRTFRAPIEDVRASVTESDRTARWFGAWKGDAAPGRMIKVQMGFEDQALSAAPSGHGEDCGLTFKLLGCLSCPQPSRQLKSPRVQHPKKSDPKNVRRTLDKTYEHRSDRSAD